MKVLKGGKSSVDGATSRLLGWLLRLTLELEGVFPQERTFDRAKRLIVSGLLTVGRRWISRMISASGRDQEDWSADYRVFSRSPWQAHDLFVPIMRHTLEMCDDEYVAVALDETKIARPGTKVKAATWLRDPMSPPFRINLMRGIRFLQFSALPPLHRREGASCRGIPVRFEMAEVVKKPGKRASEKEWEAYKKAKKLKNLSVSAVENIKAVRDAYDQAGGAEKTLIIVGDGGFCNRTVFTAEYERTILVARTRKDASLCWPAPPGSRKVYDPRRFTPEAVRQDDDIPWNVAQIFHGGMWRDVRYKELVGVLWQGGARRKPLRLIVLAPTPYRVSKNGRKYYRDPAYLLTTDHDTPAATLIQPYFDRWEIEVNHRDEKQILGLGEAQVWADKSVSRQPAFVVASYSLLLLAGLYAYGPHRTDDYELLPKWRRNAKRPSCLDLVTQLRKEAIDHPDLLLRFGIELGDNAMVRKAAG